MKRTMASLLSEIKTLRAELDANARNLAMNRWNLDRTCQLMLVRMEILKSLVDRQDMVIQSSEHKEAA